MKSAIEGPNCIDPQICRGDCCSIKIDVPKILAEEYIKRGYANKNDFIRSNIFTFHLRFNEKTGKCFLFNNEINGCLIHKSGIKPPQCWIYPTGFSNPNNIEISCKKSSGWKIINIAKAKEAEKLLQKYIFLCQIEAKKELRLIRERLGYKDSRNLKLKVKLLKEELMSIAPSHLGGFKDLWNRISVLSAEGISLQMKKFCFLHNRKCNFLSDNFLSCNKICEVVANKLIEFLQLNLYPYIKKYSLDICGDYPLFKLFSYSKLFSG
jgi:Fe-S-cluster containining protein